MERKNVKIEKEVQLRAIGKCPRCGHEEYEETETLYECEHIKISLCVCVVCDAEFINYTLKLSISNMLSSLPIG